MSSESRECAFKNLWINKLTVLSGTSSPKMIWHSMEELLLFLVGLIFELYFDSLMAEPAFLFLIFSERVLFLVPDEIDVHDFDLFFYS